MTKYKIIRDERWPDFSIECADPNGIEVPPDLLARYQAAHAEYDAVQDEIEKLYKNPVGKAWVDEHE